MAVDEMFGDGFYRKQEQILNRTLDGLTAAGEGAVVLTASTIPGLAEFMDLEVLTNPESAWWERLLVVGILTVNVLSDGYAPNAGPLLLLV